VGVEHRPSLAGVISLTRLFAGVYFWFFVSMANSVRVRKTRGLGDIVVCRPGVGRGWRDAHSICEALLLI